MTAISQLSWLRHGHHGVVERHDGEYVVTEFVDVIVPVWPRRSYFVHQDDDGAEQWLEVPLHRTSVVAGLVRTTAWMVALGCGLGAIAGTRAPWWTGPVAVLAAALAAWATWRLGRLSADERELRALLRRVVGVGVPPALRPPKQAFAVREQLDAAWSGRSGRSWQDAVLDGVADELLVALALYHERYALADRARRNLTASESALH